MNKLNANEIVDRIRVGL